MSMVGIRDFRRVMEEGDFRFRDMDVLWRVKKSEVGKGRGAEGLWVELGIARSIRRTEAPESASSIPAKGPSWSVLVEFEVKW